MIEMTSKLTPKTKQKPLINKARWQQMLSLLVAIVLHSLYQASLTKQRVHSFGAILAILIPV